MQKVSFKVWFMPHADKGNFLNSLVWVFCLTLLEGPIIKTCKQLIEILACGDPVNGHNFDHAPVLLTIEQPPGREWVDLQCLNEQLFCLYRVAEDIVVVDV